MRVKTALGGGGGRGGLPTNSLNRYVLAEQEIATIEKIYTPQEVPHVEFRCAFVATMYV
jgi:hypothetical protein